MGTMDDTRFITATSVGSIQRCPRLYKLSYIDKLTPKDKPEYMSLGSLLHDGAEQWRIAKRNGERNPLSAAIAQVNLDLPEASDMKTKALAMLEGYDMHWEGENLKYLQMEVPWVAEFESINTTLAGVADALVEKDGKLYILETKTLASITPDYIENLWSSRQAMMYMQFMKSNLRISGVIFDLVQRPAMRRKLATPVEKRRYKVDKKTKEETLYANQRERDQTQGEYYTDLVDWYRNHPEAFMRVEVTYTDNQMAQMMDDLNKVVAEIDWRTEYNIWPRALDACNARNRKCRFNTYCGSGCNDVILENHFNKKEHAHPELARRMTNDTNTEA